MDPISPNPDQSPVTMEKSPGLSVPSAQVASVKGESHNSASSAQQKKTTPPPKLLPREKAIDFTIKWTVGILTVAATIVFGIWAPLSYEATKSGNASNDQMADALHDIGTMASIANDVASSALETAIAQRSALNEMQTRVALVGQLALVDFCLTQSVGPNFNTSCSPYRRYTNVMVPTAFAT